MKVWEPVVAQDLEKGDRIIITSVEPLGTRTMIEETFRRIKYLQRGYAVLTKTKNSRGSHFFYPETDDRVIYRKRRIT